jgi:hypothetical protein
MSTSHPLHSLTPRPDRQPINLFPEISSDRPEPAADLFALLERSRAGFPRPVAVFTMSAEDMAVLYPDRARLTPADVGSWCPPRGIARPLEVTPSSVPEPRTAMGAVRPLVKPPFDWATAVPVDPYLA